MEASATPRQDDPAPCGVVSVSPAAQLDVPAQPAADHTTPFVTQPTVPAPALLAEASVPPTPNPQDMLVCHALTKDSLLLTPLSMGLAPLSSTPSLKMDESEDLHSLLKTLLEKQAKDSQLMQELLEGQKKLRAQLGEIESKCDHCQEKLMAQSRTIGSVHSEVRSITSQVEALKKEVKHSAPTAELSTVRSRLDKGLAKGTTRLTDIHRHKQFQGCPKYIDQLSTEDIPGTAGVPVEDPPQ